MDVKRCDVLCIGGGGAGVAASMTACEKGAKVILVSKEPVGYGNTRIVGGVFAYKNLKSHEDDAEVYLKDMIKGGDFLNNQDLCAIIAKETPKAALMLERFGGLVGRDKEGKISQEALIQMGGHSRPRTLLLPSVGPGLGQALRYAIANASIETLEETPVLKLLVKGKGVLGALCLDIKEGKIFAINSKNTILATGGGGWLYYPYTDVMKGCTGDGYALALNAGAELIDMEQVQFIPFSLTHPKGLAGIVVGEPFTAGPMGKLLNVDGEEILDNVYLKTRAQVSNAIILEVEKGKATKYGGVLLDLKGNKDHPQGKILFEMCQKGIFKPMTEVVRRAYGQKAADWDEPWDVYPSTHYFMGGVRIDGYGKVLGLENLYAIGEVAGGIHGANRLGSVSLVELFVFGQRAGEKAASQTKDMAQPKIEEKWIKDEEKAFEKFFSRKGKNEPILLKRRLQKLMWEAAGPTKREERLKNALEEIRKIKEEAEDLNISNIKFYNTQLMDALELPMMLNVAESIVISALTRKESRGAHIRLDYPQRNDKQWLKNCIIWKETGEIKIKLEPVKFSHLQPGIINDP